MARFQTSPDLTEMVTRALVSINRPTAEAYEVSSRKDGEDAVKFTVWYPAGAKALVLWVEFSGHGEYEYEVPGAGELVDVEPLYDMEGAELADAIATEDMEHRR